MIVSCSRYVFPCGGRGCRGRVQNDCRLHRRRSRLGRGKAGGKAAGRRAGWSEGPVKPDRRQPSPCSALPSMRGPGVDGWMSGPVFPFPREGAWLGGDTVIVPVLKSFCFMFLDSFENICCCTSAYRKPNVFPVNGSGMGNALYLCFGSPCDANPFA